MRRREFEGLVGVRVGASDADVRERAQPPRQRTSTSWRRPRILRQNTTPSIADPLLRDRHRVAPRKEARNFHHYLRMAAALYATREA